MSKLVTVKMKCHTGLKLNPKDVIGVSKKRADDWVEKGLAEVVKEKAVEAKKPTGEKPKGK